MPTIAPRTLSQHLAGATLVVGALMMNTAGEANAQRHRTKWRDSQLDTTVAFGKSGTVNVTGASGDVRVTGWSRDQVHVQGQGDGDNVRFEVNGARTLVNVSTVRGGGDASFELSVPYGTRVVVHI